MEKKKNKKILGIPLAVLLIGVLVVGGVTAVLISYFGQIETTMEVEQGLRLDDEAWDEPVEKSFSTTSAEAKTFLTEHELVSTASVDVTVDFDLSCKADEPNSCDDINHKIVDNFNEAGIQDYTVPTCNVTVTTGDTIQSGIDKAVAGDVVCVEAGTYTESVTINKGIHLVADGTVILNGHILITNNNVIVEGFKIVYDDSNTHTSKTRGILLDTGNTVNVVIKNNNIVDFATGISPGGKQAHATLVIENNVIEQSDAGIGSTENFKGTVRYNVLKNNDEGIGIGDDKLTIYGNKFLDNVADIRVHVNGLDVNATNNYFENGINIDYTTTTTSNVNATFSEITELLVPSGESKMFAVLIDVPTHTHPQTYTFETVVDLI